MFCQDLFCAVAKSYSGAPDRDISHPKLYPAVESKVSKTREPGAPAYPLD
jgi:hypothetical protein